MAQDFVHNSPIGTYTPYYIHATQAETLIATDHTHGSFLGTIVVGTAGTSDVITLANGSGNVFAVLTSPTVGTYKFYCKLNAGLFVTVAGTAGKYTINAKPMAV